MSISAARIDPRAFAVEVTDDELIVRLVDGRVVTVPLVWFPRLVGATQAQRQAWELLGDGEGLHWPQVDEDISVAGLLRGVPSHESGPRLVDPD